MSPELSSLQSFYTEKQLQSFSKKWIDSYSWASDDLSLEESFKNIFGMGYSFFGMNGNVRPVMNELLSVYYHNEAFVKSSFIKKELLKGNHVAIYELPINESRADLCRINGHSFAYEIKTEFDTLARLGKQLDDYLKAFEYVYVICSSDKAAVVLGLIPDEVGVYSYSVKAKNAHFKEIKRASMSSSISPLVQFEALSGSAKEGVNKKAGFNLMTSEAKEIVNSMFKDDMKKRYFSNWAFLKENIDGIQPLDCQYFFKTMSLSYRKLYSD
jgi:hypothetical protein